MTSPFKFLDAYGQADKDIFFGRGEEIEQLYRLVFEASLVIVYGQSGTGKSSLIQCGLANRFQPTDWFQLFVRRTDNINDSLSREIRAHAHTPIDEGASVVEAVRSLYLDHLRPIYLIFDQFEELFIIGSVEEQQAFIATITELLASDVSCKIILSLREEYLAMLNRFEKAVPTLFNKRLRVEPMSRTNLTRVITGTTDALGIRLESGEATAGKIIDNLDDPRTGVQLAYLQVYLDRLYRRAAAARDGGPIVFTDEAVDETGKLGDVLEEFLEEQIAAIQAELRARHPAIEKDLVQHLLEEFVTVEGTKQPMSRADLAARAPKAEPCLDEALAALLRVRVLRQNDALFELSHDSLAGLISERRSGERKALLLVLKLVRDRLAAFGETRTWLNPGELALIARNRSKLELSEPEDAFIRKSISKRRWRLIRRFGWIGGVLLVMVVLLLWILVQSVESEETLIRSQRDTDELVRSATLQLDPGPATATARASIRDKGKAIINAIAADSLFGEYRDDDFWTRLYQADAALEDGREAEGRRLYARLLPGTRSEFDANPTGFQQMKLERLLVRLVYAEPDRSRRRELSRQLLEVASQETGSDILNYGSAIDQACQQLEADGVTQLPARCTEAGRRRKRTLIRKSLD